MDQRVQDFSLDHFSLAGKAAIVTGGNTGLGMVYAIAFAKAGADLYIPHFTEDISEVKAAVEAEGRRVAFIRGDLTDMTYVKAAVAGCVREYGRIDILVNNAGLGHFAPFEDYPDDAWTRIINVNFNAVYFMGHEVAKQMMKQKSGKIINIGSALSYTADMNCPPYVASKHGVIGITRDFANELGQYGIQCNALCPGFFETEVNKGVQENKYIYDKICSRLPNGQWGSPDQLMGTVVFLASRASDYINGWSISVDGGFTCML